MLKKINLDFKYWWIITIGNKVRVVSGYLVGVDISNIHSVEIKLRMSEEHYKTFNNDTQYTKPFNYTLNSLDESDFKTQGVFTTLHEVQLYAAKLRRTIKEKNIDECLYDTKIIAKNLNAVNIIYNLKNLENKWSLAKQQSLTK